MLGLNLRVFVTTKTRKDYHDLQGPTMTSNDLQWPTMIHWAKSNCFQKVTFAFRPVQCPLIWIKLLTFLPRVESSTLGKEIHFAVRHRCALAIPMKNLLFRHILSGHSCPLCLHPCLSRWRQIHSSTTYWTKVTISNEEILVLRLTLSVLKKYRQRSFLKGKFQPFGTLRCTWGFEDFLFAVTT